MIPGNWREIMARGQRAELLAILPLIERFGAAEHFKAHDLSPLVDHADFAVRLRLFIAWGRLADPAIGSFLVQYIKRQPLTLWRLLALDAFSNLPPADHSELLGPLLADDDLIMIRGLLCVLGQQGPSALPWLADFVARDKCAYFRDELVAEAVFRATDGKYELLDRLAISDQCFARWYRYRIPWDGQVRFGIYPYADYLWHEAEQAGLTRSEFKRLFWWHRDKVSGSKNK